MKYYYFNSPNVGHFFAGSLLLLVPLAGMYLGGNFSIQELSSALVFWIPAVLILFGRRGVSFSQETKEFRIWYGFGFTKLLAWPIWRVKPTQFQFVMVRLRQTTNPKTPGSPLGSKSPVVWMVDENDTWVAVANAWTVSGADKKASRIARETGLPLH